MDIITNNAEAIFYAVLAVILLISMIAGLIWLHRQEEKEFQDMFRHYDYEEYHDDMEDKDEYYY